MKKYKHIRFLIFLLIALLPAFLLQGDDKELFMGFQIGTNVVRPNVVILMDSSGSMNTIIFYPKKGLDGITGTADDGYDANVAYSGSWENYTQVDELSQTQWIGRWISGGNAYEYTTDELNNIDSKNHWTGCYAGDGTPNNFQVGGNSQWFNVGERIMFEDTSAPYFEAVATIKRKYTDASGNPWFELENITGGPITVNGGHFQRCPESKTRTPVVIQLYGIQDLGYNVRYPENYIKWAYIHASADKQAAISHFSTWGTFNVNSQPTPVLSNCATPGNNDLGGTNPRIKKTFTRIQTAREVVCNVATTSNTIVKLGLFKFTTENGGSLQEGLSDMSDESSELVAYKNNVWGIAASTWTPLSEALADVWYYYKPGPASKTYWPVDWEIANNTVNHSVTNPVTPIDYWCQNNYVVIMTDGESTKDRFDDYTKYGTSIFKKKPVRRTEPWTGWNNGWGDTDNTDGTYGIPSSYNPSSTYCPNYTCWDTSHGSDYLDDVAYFMRHQDMFPDDYFGTDPDIGWPGEQCIYTYTIGFNADNHMLLQTAVNGEGAYYTATNYDELVQAFQLVITSINLRNYGFASITAPRKTATSGNDELTISYVGYFMPSQAASIWEGHLLAFRLIDSWGFDDDDSGTIEEHEFVFDTRELCLEASGGKTCVRTVSLPIGHEWDVRDKLTLDRNLLTNLGSGNLPFNLTNRDTLLPYFGSTTTELEAEQIITAIRKPQLGDIFHSDVAFIGSPSYGKQFRRNINPPNEDDETFAAFYEANKDRRNVLYAGTNDGIFHMFYADDLYSDAGEEIWGLIPDAVLPSLRTIVIDGKHTYTVDGRTSANDVYFQKEGQTFNSWSTILTFGLRRGGKYYYTLDVTQVSSQPQLLWKFTDSTFSGESWGKPLITKIRLKNPDNTELTIDKYVVFFTGGFAYNSEYGADQKGKAIFMVDAGTGELLWMIGYDETNGAFDAVNSPDKEEIEMDAAVDGIHFYTKSPYFNFPIATSLTAIDKDNNDLADTLYFGNIGGHLFKTDISSFDTSEWKTYLIYKTNITTRATTTISSIADVEITVASKTNFLVGDTIIGQTSHAYGYIREIDNKVFSVVMMKGTFQVGETIVVRTYDPIYLSPAMTYDTCNQIWITFGTGDRDRPRSSNHVGRFIAIKDVGNTGLTLSNLNHLTWGSTDTATDLPQAELTSSKGWYFNFSANYEKLFDPDPVVLPDQYGFPHIYFNTYQPPTSGTNPQQDNPCTAPSEGKMTLYDIAITTCGMVDTIEGERTTGRIAGGGVYNSKEYVLYTSTTGNVADVPGEDDYEAWPVKLFDPFGRGSFIFWKEKKR